MSRYPFTEEHKAFIVENIPVYTIKEIAAFLNIDRHTLRKYMAREDIALSVKERLRLLSERNRQKTTATEAEDNFIKDNYLTMPIKVMAKKINRTGGFVITRLKRLGLVIPKEIIDQRKKDSRFQAGHLSPIKGKKQTEFMTKEAIERSKPTRFQKGLLPHNTRHNGAISVHKSKKGKHYKWIRLGLKNWKMLHVYNWEKKYGPVPKGHIVVFRNKNTMQCNVRNLKLITRPEHMANNTIHRYPAELKELIRLHGKLKRKIKHATEQNN